MLYKQEFGRDFDLGFDLESHPYLIDKSWHNDLCPSFYFNVGEQYYLLWVDYADEGQREEAKTTQTQHKYPETKASKDSQHRWGSMASASKSFG